MKKILILGVMAVMVTFSLTAVLGENKSIDIDTFSIGDDDAYVNMTASQIVIEDSLENNSANLFVYNNATYDLVSFDVTGGPNADGIYPSNVMIDLGDNGMSEYRFAGYGVGQWGNQTNIMNPAKQSSRQADIYPSSDGVTYYIKVPSDATVTSASINMTHPPGMVTRSIRIPSNRNWAYGFTYGRGYSKYMQYYPWNYAGYNVHPTYYYGYYPAYNSGSYYQYYGAYARGYLSWDINDPNLIVPEGANLQQYNLVWPSDHWGSYHNTPQGYTYHIGGRDYDLHAVTGNWRTSYYSGYTYYTYHNTQFPWFINNICPSLSSSSYATYEMDDDYGTSYKRERIVWDLSDLLSDWQDGTQTNYGVGFMMGATQYDTGEPHDGYSSSSFSYNYYRAYRRGEFMSPGASSYYNSEKPMIELSYSLDSIGPWLDVGDDDSKEWTHTGYFNGTQILSGWQSSMNKYLGNHFPDEVDEYGNKWTYVPLKLGAEAGGKIVASDIDVKYDYTASVYYNPAGTLTDELQSHVPSSEDGHKLVNIMTRSNTQGVLEFSDLKLIGEKPNYRPGTMEIPTVESFEGDMNDMLIPLSDYFFDIDQDPADLDYSIIMNDQPDHVDLFINKVEGTRAGTVYLGIDTSKDENWYGDVNVQVMVMDEFGKGVESNIFTIGIESVNDIPYVGEDFQNMELVEGIDHLVIEYEAPSGRSVARGKEAFMIDRSGAPYFMDIEGDDILMDFELLGPDMEPVNLEWDNGEGYKIYMAENNEAYLTVLPPEYTEDPDNWILLFGTDPDFTTTDSGPYHLKVYVADDMGDIHEQMNASFEIHVSPINDAPVIIPIPDIVMDEDSIFTSPTPFLAEYVSDIDNDLSDLEVMFHPADAAVHVDMDQDGMLVVSLDMDFNGVVPVTMEVTDGVNTEVRDFNVRVRSINDPPVLVIDNLYEDQIISELYRVKGSADDIEKDLRNIEIAIIRTGDILYTDDWIEADGAYVWQYLMDIRNFEEGRHTVYIRGFDGRDFSDVKEFNVYFEPPEPPLPPPPPTLTMTTVLTGEQSDTIEVHGDVADESGYISFVEYRIDGSIWRKAIMETGSDWKLTIDTNTLTNDEHNLSVRAYNGKTYSDIAFQKFDVMNVDSDGDGIPNALEISLLMDPFNELDGNMDFDGDGFSNFEELQPGVNTDPFDGNSHPEREKDKESLVDSWALIFMIAAIVCAILIIGLFILNIRLERNIHKWREDLSGMRVERKPKTLLQKIVEIAPTFAGAAMVNQGPALPGGGAGEQAAALPPMQEGEMPPNQ